MYSVHMRAGGRMAHCTLPFSVNPYFTIVCFLLGELQRRIGVKALALGGNVVLG